MSDKTLGTIVAISAIVVSALVALVIAAMHRKQMRQIELHREDPSVPLKPPPGPIARFFKIFVVLLFPILGILASASMLHQDLNKSGPIDRGDVFEVALHVVSMGWNFMWVVLWLILRSTIRTLRK